MTEGLLGLEAQKPRQRVSVANRKYFARPENFCAFDIKGHNFVSILSRRYQFCLDSFNSLQTVSKLSG